MQLTNGFFYGKITKKIENTKKLCFFTLDDLKECISVVIVHQKHSLVVFQSFEKNIFLEFQLNLA